MESWTYDAQDRLTSHTTPERSTTWQLDAGGRRIQQTVVATVGSTGPPANANPLEVSAGAPIGTLTYSYNIRHDRPILRLSVEQVHTRQSGEATQTTTEDLLVTPGHPFYVEGQGFVSVEDLQQGDELVSLGSGKTLRVKGLVLEAPQGTTHNLTVDKGHTFFVGNLGTWVHNVGPCNTCPGGACGTEKATGSALESTDPVVIGGSRAIDKAQSYERGVRGMYGNSSFSERQYTAIVDGRRVLGVADEVTVIGGKPTAVEAKFVYDWGRSIRNPASPSGSRPWSLAEQKKMLDQAKKYSSGFDGGVVYHTNSSDLAIHYSKIFNEAGVENFKFLITPVKK